ncbi:MAG TPA: hypothetical protein VMS78_04085 [Rhizomicrobium sp.]|nr:hypothetical protein [Rhizomicrobium sp.]
MWRALVLVLTATALAGCLPKSTKQLEASCQLDATKFAAIHDKDGDQFADIAEMTELCMKSQGYEVIEKLCPYSMQIANHPVSQVEVVSNLQREEPSCYRPIGISDRLN